MELSVCVSEFRKMDRGVEKKINSGSGGQREAGSWRGRG